MLTAAFSTTSDPTPPPRRRTTSRRVSAGIHPAPGVVAALPAWWGATDWIDVEVRGALNEHRDLCRAHHVQPDTVLAVARGMAHYADHTTGRDCRPTNARLVALLRMSLSTVQRARRVLKALGLVVELVAGRSIMTRDERLAAHARGSSHRQIAAEFALCSRPNRPTPPPGSSRSRRRSKRSPFRRAAGHSPTATRSLSPVSLVDGDTPPGAPPEHLSSHLPTTHLQATTEQRKAAPRPAPTDCVDDHRPERALHLVPTPTDTPCRPPAAAGGAPPVPLRPRTGPDPRTRRLAEGVRGRLGWLSGTSARRLGPTLHRFAAAGWTPRDIDRAVTDALATRGWRLPRHLTQPAAYLATLLRALDPEDRPGALDEHIAAVEAAQHNYQRLLIFGRPCPHGTPAGDIPSPLRGQLACPSCRRDA